MQNENQEKMKFPTLSVEALKSKLPETLQGSGCAYDAASQSIYIHGGRFDLFSETTSLYHFDVVNQVWKKLFESEEAPLKYNDDGEVIEDDKPRTSPKPRCGHGMIFRENQLFVFGGMMEGKFENCVWVFDLCQPMNTDPKLNVWKRVESNTPPRSFFAMDYDVASDRIIIHGGKDDEVHSTQFDLYELSLKDFNDKTNNLEWHEINVDLEVEEDGMIGLTYPLDGPMPRMEHTGCLFDGGKKFIVYGGWTCKHQTCEDAWIFNLESKKWSEVTPATKCSPATHLGHTGFMIGDNYFAVCGGNSDHGSTITVLDIENSTWKDFKFDSYLIGTHCFSVSLNLNGKLAWFVAGGTCSTKSKEGYSTMSATDNAYIVTSDMPVKKRENEGDNPESKSAKE